MMGTAFIILLQKYEKKKKKADTLSSMGGNCYNLFQWLYTSQNIIKIIYVTKAHHSMFSMHS